MALTSSPSTYRWPAWLELLRWHKPTGRLILLLPAGWSLWLASAEPPRSLLVLIVLGGLAVSGAGCIANDLWDHRIDADVSRTSSRPLARGALSFGYAWTLLLLCLLTALLVVLELPEAGRELSFKLALLALPPI
ncbi:MAG: UbiA family prenyltransferase, partial [Synechococcus sp.]|nr:UbiA family prenyltransferase [Synechococcus sp.]